MNRFFNFPITRLPDHSISERSSASAAKSAAGKSAAAAESTTAAKARSRRAGARRRSKGLPGGIRHGADVVGEDHGIEHGHVRAAVPVRRLLEKPVKSMRPVF